MIARALAGTALAAVGSAAALRAETLTRDGAFAAWAVGSAVIAGTSWRGATLLGAFFVSSSALTRLRDRREVVAARDQPRNARQVVANGGIAALAALVGWQGRRDRMFAVLAGSLGAAAADTWATEVGATSPRDPRLLVSRRPTAPGTSGGVTARGLGASVAGACLLGCVAALVSNPPSTRLGAAVTVAGIGGSLLDSLHGEFVQERRHCPVCRVSTERIVHRCGSETQLRGGVRGIDNDVVNLFATAAGGVFAALVAGRRTLAVGSISTIR